ncbi:phosphoribosyl-AMP cyclohydrolase [Sphingomonas sp.]|jgi:phosphoribosyl-AMP cyclohydrolase|uniref:phosphoribosyl-AMP cyclohydrolase n=1 Tax=Sphingomonas sp. TaxID=28214 RepID=UPI002ED97E06
MTDREEGRRFDPKFDSAGLVTAVVTTRENALLMVAHMNSEALAATQASGEATFFSRSRARLWRKGETSGNILRVVEMRVDCDQDAILMIVDPTGPACHTGRKSCFYRRIEADGSLTFLA